MELDEAGGSQQQPGSSDGEAPVVIPEIVTMRSRFENVQEKGNIDVWWIYDDGGNPSHCPSPFVTMWHVRT